MDQVLKRRLVTKAVDDELTSADRESLQIKSGMEESGLNELYRFLWPGHAERTVFDVRGIKSAILNDAMPYQVKRAPITKEWAVLVIGNTRVSLERLAALEEPELSRIGVCIFQPNGVMAIIDGTHRFIKRGQLGYPDFRYVLIKLDDCAPWTCPQSEEQKFYEAAAK